MSHLLDALQALTRRGISQRAAHANGRRFLIIHLDGVSRTVLRHALDRGRMPRLNRRLERAQLELTESYSGTPASTPCFQAGLLWGVRADIPGFLWYDKRRRAPVRMDSKGDAARTERQVSRGQRGLLEKGTTYFSLFSGDSCVNGWCLTGRSSPPRYHLGGNSWDHLGLGLAHLPTLGRVVGRSAVEAATSFVDGLSWVLQTGRSDHERAFFLNRILLSAGAREVATTATILDVVRGVPSIYCCFADYDEVSHRRGPTSEPALRALESTDRSLDLVLKAVDAVDRSYDVYILADHGQVATRPMEGVVGRSLRQVALGPCRPRGAKPLAGVDGLERDLVCIDAGNVAHLYLVGDRDPLELEALRSRYPQVLASLEACPAVGAIGVRGGQRGFAYRDGQWLDLADAAQSERLGRSLNQPRAGEAIRQMLALSTAGDLVVYGNGVQGGDIAYAWEYGSHGGIGRDEVETFVLHPPGMGAHFRSLDHAQDLYQFFSDRYGLSSAAPLSA